MSRHFLLPGVVPTQGLACIACVSCVGRRALYHYSHLGRPPRWAPSKITTSPTPPPQRQGQLEAEGTTVAPTDHCSWGPGVWHNTYPLLWPTPTPRLLGPQGDPAACPKHKELSTRALPTAQTCLTLKCGNR